jgi:hypothetical protein
VGMDDQQTIFNIEVAAESFICLGGCQQIHDTSSLKQSNLER